MAHELQKANIMQASTNQKVRLDESGSPPSNPLSNESNRNHMWRLISPFSVWVLPFRVTGAVVFLYAFIRMLVTPDLTILAITIVGSLLWLTGTAIEERSALFRRMEETPIRDVARTRLLKVPAWTSVARFHREHPVVSSDTFVITTQDRYDAGIVTPEELYRVSANEAAYVSLGQLAKPISFVDALRFEDSVLEAFLRFRSNNRWVLSVLDKRGAFGGLVTRSDVDRWSNNLRIQRVRDAAPARESTSNQKLAA